MNFIYDGLTFSTSSSYLVLKVVKDEI